MGFSVLAIEKNCNNLLYFQYKDESDINRTIHKCDTYS